MRGVWLGLALLLCVAGCGQAPATPHELVARQVAAGEYEQAIAACDALLKADPQDNQALLYRGRAYHRRNQSGDLDRALADFSESIRIAPQSAPAYYDRSIAYRDLGKAEESAADEKKARELDGDVKEVYAHLTETVDIVPPLAPAESATEDSKTDAATGSKESESASDVFETKDLHESVRSRLRDADETDRALGRGAGAGMPDRLNPRRAAIPAPFPSGADLMPTEEPAPSAFGTTTPQQSPAPQAGPGSSRSRAAPRGGNAMGPAMNNPYSRMQDVPQSPWQPRGPSMAAPNLGTSVHSPFPQRAPRPTGYVEEAPQSPFRAPAQGGYYNNPYSPPTNHPPGAYHSDFNP